MGEVLFRYVISTCEGEVSDSYASVFGWQAVTQFEQIFTNKQGKGSLPASDSFMNTNNENVVLLNCKKAEDDDGYIVRLWNMTNKTESVKVRLNYMKIRGASLADLTEEDSGIRIAYDDQGFSLIMEKSAVATIRIRI
ncbi:MAG: hypothetical protein K8F30_08020 [Taibaiella sp.]|nr:hypothetical protein [Taibaiella sp.]